MSSLIHNYLTRIPFTLILIVVILGSSASVIRAQSNEYCPVTTSEKSDSNIFLDYQGKRIYFCCNKCKRDFIADPDAYVKNLQVQETKISDDTSNQTESETAHTTNSHENHSHDTADNNLNNNDTSVSKTAHDHATDHDESSDIIGFLGKFHPVIIHFSIALVIMALIFVGTRFVLGTEMFDHMAVITIYWAAFFAIISALLGLARASGAQFPDSLEEFLEWHRLLGLISTGLTVLTAIAGYYWRKKSSSQSRILFFALLVLNVIAIGITGHLGATLVYGPNYYNL